MNTCQGITFCLVTCIVNNGSNPPERFRVRVRTRTTQLQRFSHTNTLNHCSGAGYHLKPGLGMPRFFAPIKDFSSDCIMTLSICRLFSFCRSFSTRFHICNTTNIWCVAREHQRMWSVISSFSPATEQILLPSQIWKRDVKEGLKQHNIHCHHVMIWSELKYLIGAKVEPKLYEP
jgi:hypothetical protein